MTVLEAIIKLEYMGSKQGEKTGWFVLRISPEQALTMGHKGKTSFRVKGKLDEIIIKQKALIPLGNGDFVLPIAAPLRKKLGKGNTQPIKVYLQLDNASLELDNDFEACLADNPLAKKNFELLTAGTKRYFNNHVASAKTEATKQKRIIQCLTAFEKNWDFGTMIRKGREI
jgi:hypothetical protein